MSQRQDGAVESNEKTFGITREMNQFNVIRILLLFFFLFFFLLMWCFSFF